MGVEVTSTTDSPEDVQAAAGLSQEVVKQNEETQVEESAESVEASAANEEAEESQEEESEESGEEAEESSEEESEDSETSEEEGEEEEDEQPKSKRRRGRGYKQRIQKLNGRLSKAEQEAEYWRNLALKNEGAEQNQDAKPEAHGAPTDGKPDADDFESEAEYIEALTDWKVDQKFKAQKAAAQVDARQSDLEAKADKLKMDADKFADAHDDFDEVLEDVSHIQASATIQEAILDSENGPLLMYELAKNPEEYERINSLSPAAAARAIGRFEAKFLDASPSPSKKNLKAKKKTKAARPLEPVSKGGAKSTKSPDEMTFQEYKVWAAQNIKSG